jgi:hypothetical protein
VFSVTPPIKQGEKITFYIANVNTGEKETLSVNIPISPLAVEMMTPKIAPRSDGSYIPILDGRFHAVKGCTTSQFVRLRNISNMGTITDVGVTNSSKNMLLTNSCSGSSLQPASASTGTIAGSCVVEVNSSGLLNPTGPLDFTFILNGKNSFVQNVKVQIESPNAPLPPFNIIKTVADGNDGVIVNLGNNGSCNSMSFVYYANKQLPWTSVADSSMMKQAANENRGEGNTVSIVQANRSAGHHDSYPAGYCDSLSIPAVSFGGAQLPPLSSWYLPASSELLNAATAYEAYYMNSEVPNIGTSVWSSTGCQTETTCAEALGVQGTPAIFPLYAIYSVERSINSTSVLCLHSVIY